MDVEEDQSQPGRSPSPDKPPSEATLPRGTPPTPPDNNTVGGEISPHTPPGAPGVGVGVASPSASERGRKKKHGRASESPKRKRHVGEEDKR